MVRWKTRWWAMTDAVTELTLWKRKAQRERAARVEAERLLERKAADLLRANIGLEQEVASRTAELVRARDEAIAAGRARTDFLARMSHEIRTPMNAVIGMAELMLMDTLDPGVARGVRTIRSAADALLALVNDILDFSKIEAGGLALQSIEFDLDAQVSSVIELMTAPARKAGLELRVDMDPRTSGVMLGDESRLRQILLNLVGNAVKFTARGFVEVRTRVLEEQGDEQCIEFCVADTGPGIAKHSQDAIFEVFEQGDGSSTRRHGGTGLGLAISRRLVELFGGRLWVESELGRGARFFFTVWLQRLGQATQAPIPPWNVLLLGGDDETLEAMRGAVRPTGGCVVSVSDTLSALCQLANAALACRCFDVVLLDAEGTAASVILPALAVPELAGVRSVLFGVQEDPETTAATLSLPMQLGPAVAAAALRTLANREVVPARSPVTTAHRKAVILLVDDNPANRAITARLLEKVGHTVQTAKDGGEALSAATSGEFDLIFMDVQMPGLDGVAATERIRGWESTRGRRVAIVGLSAVTSPEELARCRRAGMDDFLTKPIRSAALFEMVQGVLARSDEAPANDAVRPTIAERLRVPEVVDALGADEESARLCLEVFVASNPQQAAGLRRGIEARDPEQLRAVGHLLSGSFMGLIRPRLLEYARALEDAVVADAAMDEVLARAARLEACLDELDREVRAHLQSPQPMRMTAT